MRKALTSRFREHHAFLLGQSFVHLDFLEQFGAEDVRAILASLPEHYRIPLVLTYMDGFATKEMARILNLPLGTVLARLHRGRKLFEKRMWEYAETHALLREPVA